MGAKIYWIIFATFLVLITLQTVHYMEFQDRMKSFVSKGPRFTAQDGQTLCERVAALEQNPKPCGYGGK